MSEQGSVPGDAGQALTYAGYLHLDALLEAQQPLSGQHDEMLFIVMHQVSEMWLKLALFELQAAMARLRADALVEALALLQRVVLIQHQMLGGWDVLMTLSPVQFSAFRNALGKSSGLQSLQYRLLESLLGHRTAATLALFRDDAAGTAALERAYAVPGLYDDVLRYLTRRGITVPASVLGRDVTQPYQPHPAVERAWLRVYRDAEGSRDLYELAERLLDIDQNLQSWRMAHMKIVDRVIGSQPGTGGTGGVSYLTKSLDLKFFPELWAIRSSL
jgi:tryptophan 2,3-dioxygenase